MNSAYLHKNTKKCGSCDGDLSPTTNESCPHIEICRNCNSGETHGYIPPTKWHYGQCIYCIMDHANTATDYWWDEEYGSWGEVATRALELYHLGCDDAFEHDECYTVPVVKGSWTNLAAFIAIYKQGFEDTCSTRTPVTERRADL